MSSPLLDDSLDDGNISSAITIQIMEILVWMDK
jgi:hypothetical protein